MSKNWKKEVARDCIALGSIPFYLIVIIRAIVGEFAIFIYQLLISLIVLVLLSQIVKKSDMYIARAFILWVFTSLFYKHNLYTVFAFLLLIAIVVSLNYLRVKKDVIVKGVLLGIISSGVAYYLAGFVG